MPPDWYPDPDRPGLLRWWDGRRWTEHTAWAQQPTQSQQYRAPAFDAAADFRKERSAARWAALAVVAAVPVLVVQNLLLAVAIHRLGDAVRDFDRINGGFSNSDNNFVLPANVKDGLLLVQAISGLTLIAEVLFLIWFFRSATLAARAGIPAKHSPPWAIFGFLIPVVNFWFPYQVARDLFPPRHPAHAWVKWWWALWLATQFVATPLYVASFFSLGTGLILIIPAALVAAAAAYTAWRLIGEAVGYHCELLRL